MFEDWPFSYRRSNVSLFFSRPRLQLRGYFFVDSSAYTCSPVSERSSLHFPAAAIAAVAIDRITRKSRAICRKTEREREGEKKRAMEKKF